MWLAFALVSALFLGLYDVAKKQSLKENAVIPVLWFNTLFCSLLMLPFTLLSATTGLLDGSIFYVPSAGWELHRLLMLKAFIVLGSWIFGYFGMKHLPITLFGPINATRPIIVLLGGLLLFGERLNLYQWIGVIIAVISFYMLSVSGKKEGISFTHNKWVFCVIMATLLGAVSALFDKYLLGRFNNMFVQAWSNFYQLALMTVILFTLWWPTRHKTLPDPGRLRLLCLPGPKRLHGLHSLHDPPLQRNRKLPLRRPPLPREKPQEQNHRPPSGPPGPLLPAYRFSAVGNSRFILQI